MPNPAPPGYRLLLFADDEERLLMRFCHRSAAAVNITFIRTRAI